MERKIDMEEVCTDLRSTVATLDLFYEVFSHEVCSAERLIQEHGGTGIGTNFVHRAYELYEPAISKVYTNLFDLLERVEEATA